MIQLTSHLRLRRLADIFNRSKCDSVTGMNTLQDRTHKESLRQHCVDVTLIVYNIIKHYCFKTGEVREENNSHTK